MLVSCLSLQSSWYCRPGSGLTSSFRFFSLSPLYSPFWRMCFFAVDCPKPVHQPVLQVLNRLPNRCCFIGWIHQVSSMRSPAAQRSFQGWFQTSAVILHVQHISPAMAVLASAKGQFNAAFLAKQWCKDFLILTSKVCQVLACHLLGICRSVGRRQKDPSRRDSLIQTARGRCSPVGKGVPMKGEGETWSLYRRFGEQEVRCSCRSLQFLLPGVACPDKATLALETALALATRMRVKVGDWVRQWPGIST